MYKDTIVYEDFNGDIVEEELYFNLTKAEAIDLEMSVEGGYSNKLQEVVNSQNTQDLLAVIKTLVLKAYGHKSEDGRRFIKSDEDTTAFLQSEAFSEFYFSLFTGNGEKLREFTTGILPKVEGFDANKVLSGELSPEEALEQAKAAQNSRQSLSAVARK